MMHDDGIVTVWSAPNYCYRCGNVASVFQVDDLINNDTPANFGPSHFKIFDAVPNQEHMVPGTNAATQYFL